MSFELSKVTKRDLQYAIRTYNGQFTRLKTTGTKKQLTDRIASVKAPKGGFKKPKNMKPMQRKKKKKKGAHSYASTFKGPN